MLDVKLMRLKLTIQNLTFNIHNLFILVAACDEDSFY